MSSIAVMLRLQISEVHCKLIIEVPIGFNSTRLRLIKTYEDLLHHKYFMNAVIFEK